MPRVGVGVGVGVRVRVGAGAGAKRVFKLVKIGLGVSHYHP